MIRLLAILMLLGGCRHEAQKSPAATEDLRQEYETRCARVEINKITRCDRVTFVGLLAAFCPGREGELARYENPAGKWNRDTETCWPTDSSSETSRDGYLSVLHKAFSDADIVKRIVKYAEPNDWNTGEGPDGVQNIWPLAPTMRLMLDGQRLQEDSDQLPFLAGFRGHLVGSYILLRGRIKGSIGPLEYQFAEQLAAEDVESVRKWGKSPFFSALVHRFSDGDQTEAENILRNFPEGESPYGWGSCPNDIYWILSYATMKGF
jgi:hypothetical protein